MCKLQTQHASWKRMWSGGKESFRILLFLFSFSSCWKFLLRHCEISSLNIYNISFTKKTYTENIYEERDVEESERITTYVTESKSVPYQVPISNLNNTVIVLIFGDAILFLSLLMKNKAYHHDTIQDRIRSSS